ncbi:transglycosylase domain-containing protein [Nevskia sp.]|uniref:transglycosylase domain-containing protein n=1 Tax=Nevskia sp. TaxID=1929292 RepID=UPI0025E696B8|nr:transglycosylase domain-containing protein [Nevskia sp.]
MSITRRSVIRLLAVLAVALIGATALSQRALPDRLLPEADAATRAIVLDRSGAPLNVRYQQRWNTADRLPLSDVPAFLRQAIVTAEDRRYWQHGGIDWRARISAIEQSLRARRAVRGASTISEQVVRLLHPRPRTVWSRWVEGFEAMRLEARFSKSEILEFYLDQVPYGAHRRGVVQAARHYFGREPATLSEPEMLALAVMPRAPSRLDPIRDPARLAGPMQRVAARMAADGLIAADRIVPLATPPPALRADDDEVPAAAFIAEVLRRAPPALAARGAIRSSLDRPLQREAQRLLDQRVQELARVGVRQGALLVIDRIGNRVRAWNVANLDAAPGETGIDTVQTARQPGSALKPFVYALALESGWTAATAIEDDLLAAHVSDGIHPYRNYSRLSYGTVTVREALGNSLNVPAVKALQFVGGDRFLNLLRQLGMKGLTAHPDWYGDGIALGNGEVTLLELVNAYSTLANLGRARPLTVFEGAIEAQPETPVINREAASIVTDILSDPHARLLEFGSGGLLRFPAQTAVKTGTSSDYRDAWCVAFNHRYVVGAWMGALAGQPMDGVTGSIGPALLVRSVFAVLNRDLAPEPLPRSPLLIARMVPAADGGEYREWFAPDAADPATPVPPEGTAGATPQWLQPFDGLRIAIDPRVPPAQQALEFRLDAAADAGPVRWFVDEQPVGRSEEPRWLWPLERGDHRAHAEASSGQWRTSTVQFRVK